MTRAGLLTAILVVGLTVAGVAAQQRLRIPPTGAIKIEKVTHENTRKLMIT